ncbi:TRAM domain-containing protein, partial [Candidatus Peregrinibacteria bacterium]|nr:TRAM domain-containing protein [Candidatus Peregrinibacteria bacterium]
MPNQVKTLPFKKHSIVTVKITDIAFGGAGVGKMALGETSGDFVVFVPHTMPGDIVEARLSKIKKQYA